LLEIQVARRIEAVERSLAAAADVPAALAAVSAELGRADPEGQLLFVEFWQRAVRDPDVRAAFVASRHRLRARVAEAVAAFLATLPADPGWDPDGLALVVVALATGIALEERVDPGTVPAGLPARVLAALVRPGD
jgi:BetI-type transcriptional repressor, C-terminal